MNLDFSKERELFKSLRDMCLNEEAFNQVMSKTYVKIQSDVFLKLLNQLDENSLERNQERK